MQNPIWKNLHPVTELIVEEENWEGISEHRRLLDELDYLKWLGALEKMSKERIPPEQFDPKVAIKKNAEMARDWEYSEEAEYLYSMANHFKDRFLDPILHTDRGRLPDPVISFDDLRNRKVLAAYTLHRNPQGLLDEITFNTAHYTKKDGKKEWVF